MSLGPLRTWIAASAGWDVTLGRMSSVARGFEEGAVGVLVKGRLGRLGGCVVDIKLKKGGGFSLGKGRGSWTYRLLMRVDERCRWWTGRRESDIGRNARRQCIGDEICRLFGISIGPGDEDLCKI